jgi:hypothetical protein
MRPRSPLLGLLIRLVLGLVLGLPLAGALAACTAEQTVALEPVAGASTRGSAFLHEAITKSFTVRVDAFVEVDAPAPGMGAAVQRGGCAAPGEVVQRVAVHERGVGGAADVVLNEGKLADLAGCSIHVYAGEPGASPRLACGEL